MIRRALLVLTGLTLSACRRDAPSTDSTSAGPVPGTPRSTAIDTSNAAWWVSWRIPPRGVAVGGIPVGALDPTWTAATTLESVNAPVNALDSVGTFRQMGARFTLDGDFNRDGQPDRALVGTYRAGDGTEGRFLLILTRAPSGQWEKPWVTTLPGAAAFSAIIPASDGDGLIWLQCLECDTSTDVRWTGSRYEATLESCCDDDADIPADTSKVSPPPPTTTDPSRAR